MKGLSVLVTLGLLAVACDGGADAGTTTSLPHPSTTQTTAPISTTTAPLATSTTMPMTPVFDVSNLPGGGCQNSIDSPPVGGEPTVLVGERLYGLGPDFMSPRCLLEPVTSNDIEWGPAGDRVRVGNHIYADSETVVLDAEATFEWTAPTGSKVVVISGDRVTKVALDGSEELNIKFLDDTEVVTYHPAGTHLLAVGTDVFGQYGLWFASNDGVNFVLLAFDQDATISDPVWSWLNDPLLSASHNDGHWHIHRVELVDGNFEGPIVVDSIDPIDLLITSPYDPVMLAYRLGGERGVSCVDGSQAAVNGVDLPEPLASYTSQPVGWLSNERLLILAYPDGCESRAELWSFSAGFCPGSVYGAELLITGVDGAAAREAAPPPPPAPDFTGVIEPAPA